MKSYQLKEKYLHYFFTERRVFIAQTVLAVRPSVRPSQLYAILCLYVSYNNPLTPSGATWVQL